MANTYTQIYIPTNVHTPADGRGRPSHIVARGVSLRDAMFNVPKRAVHLLRDDRFYGEVASSS